MAASRMSIQTYTRLPVFVLGKYPTKYFLTTISLRHLATRQREASMCLRGKKKEIRQGYCVTHSPLTFHCGETHPGHGITVTYMDSNLGPLHGDQNPNLYQSPKGESPLAKGDIRLTMLQAGLHMLRDSIIHLGLC